MTQRLDWTPVSKLPWRVGEMLVWVSCGAIGYWARGEFQAGMWLVDKMPLEAPWRVTHWRDIEPPEEA